MVCQKRKKNIQFRVIEMGPANVCHNSLNKLHMVYLAYHQK